MPPEVPPEMNVESEINLQSIAGDLAQIVEAVFENMLGLEVARGGEPWFPGEDRLRATVLLTGAWKGAVAVECSRRQACQFAAGYLSIEPPAINPAGGVDEVVRDALGELANMIGGNWKCILMPGIYISMPEVVEGSGAAWGSEVRESLAFECREGTFWVTVLADGR
jgi:CheY-specific phosphatase CheX